MSPTDTTVSADFTATVSAASASAASVPNLAAESAASAPAPSSAYRDRLNPWCVVRLSEQAPTTVARFRRRPDAEAHLHLLSQGKRDRFAIVFNKPVEAAE